MPYRVGPEIVVMGLNLHDIAQLSTLQHFLQCKKISIISTILVSHGYKLAGPGQLENLLCLRCI
ncbi:hypothetical protein D1872_274520 [compost metagenome]